MCQLYNRTFDKELLQMFKFLGTPIDNRSADARFARVQELLADILLDKSEFELGSESISD